MAQHGPNIGLKSSKTRKTPPLALLNPSPPRGAQIKQQFFIPVLKPRNCCPFSTPRPPPKVQKGYRNPHSRSKMYALFPRRKPPRQAQKGHGNPHLCSKMHTLFPLRKPPRQSQKGHRNPHFYYNVSPMTTPKPSRTLSIIYTTTLRNLINFLYRTLHNLITRTL